jgi:hypothetical protein
VFVLSFDTGPAVADQAADELSQLLGVPVDHATFFGGVLRMSKQ